MAGLDSGMGRRRGEGSLLSPSFGRATALSRWCVFRQRELGVVAGGVETDGHCQVWTCLRRLKPIQSVMSPPAASMPFSKESKISASAMVSVHEVGLVRATKRPGA